ncbi:MAG: hypothetical protein EXS09_08315 [Gemmataceae bacterium]|nr:hypothetical protein [Gemmataceae bacterium]
MSLIDLMPAVRSLKRDEQVKPKLYLESALAEEVCTEKVANSNPIDQSIATAPCQFDRPEATAEGIAVLERIVAEGRANRR